MSTDGSYAPATLAYSRPLRAFPFGVGRDAARRRRGPRALTTASRAPRSPTSTTRARRTRSRRRGRGRSTSSTSRTRSPGRHRPGRRAGEVRETPRGAGHRLRERGFNARWRVKAGDQKFAHDIVHPAPDGAAPVVRRHGDSPSVSRARTCTRGPSIAAGPRTSRDASASSPPSRGSFPSSSTGSSRRFTTASPRRSASAGGERARLGEDAVRALERPLHGVGREEYREMEMRDLAGD